MTGKRENTFSPQASARPMTAPKTLFRCISLCELDLLHTLEATVSCIPGSCFKLNTILMNTFQTTESSGRRSFDFLRAIFFWNSELIPIKNYYSIQSYVFNHEKHILNHTHYHCQPFVCIGIRTGN